MYRLQPVTQHRDEVVVGRALIEQRDKSHVKGYLFDVQLVVKRPGISSRSQARGGRLGIGSNFFKTRSNQRVGDVKGQGRSRTENSLQTLVYALPLVRSARDHIRVKTAWPH